MKTKIEVDNREESDLIRRGLSHPETRALVKVMGALLPLDERSRRRALNFVADKLDMDFIME